MLENGGVQGLCRDKSCQSPWLGARLCVLVPLVFRPRSSSTCSYYRTSSSQQPVLRAYCRSGHCSKDSDPNQDVSTAFSPTSGAIYKGTALMGSSSSLETQANHKNYF